MSGAATNNLNSYPVLILGKVLAAIGDGSLDNAQHRIFGTYFAPGKGFAFSIGQLASHNLPNAVQCLMLNGGHRFDLVRREPRPIRRPVHRERHCDQSAHVCMGPMDLLHHRTLLIHVRDRRLLPRPLPPRQVQRHRPDERPATSRAAHGRRQERRVQAQCYQAPSDDVLDRCRVRRLRERRRPVIRVYFNVGCVFLSPTSCLINFVVDRQFAQQRLNKGAVIGGWVSSFYLLLPAGLTPFLGIYVDLCGQRILFRTFLMSLQTSDMDILMLTFASQCSCLV